MPVQIRLPPKRHFQSYAKHQRVDDKSKTINNKWSTLGNLVWTYEKTLSAKWVFLPEMALGHWPLESTVPKRTQSCPCPVCFILRELEETISAMHQVARDQEQLSRASFDFKSDLEVSRPPPLL